MDRANNHVWKIKTHALNVKKMDITYEASTHHIEFTHESCDCARDMFVCPFFVSVNRRRNYFFKQLRSLTNHGNYFTSSTVYFQIFTHHILLALLCFVHIFHKQRMPGQTVSKGQLLKEKRCRKNPQAGSKTYHTQIQANSNRLSG